MRQEEEEEADEGGKRKLGRQVLRQLCQEKEKNIGALSWARVASQDAHLVPAQQPAASSGQVRTVFKLPFLSVILL